MAQEDLRSIPLHQISLSPHQMRSRFDPKEIEELAQSIEAVGLIQPIVVQVVKGGYQLIAGERRLRALRSLKWDKTWAIVKPRSDLNAAHSTLIENIQRVDLNPIEIATAYHRLMRQFSLTQEELSQRVGKRRSTVANYLRLLTLDEEVQEGLRTGEISMGHAKALMAQPSKELQRLLFHKIVEEKWSVRKAEEAQTSKRTSTPREEDPYVLELAQLLEEHLSTRVDLQVRGEKGKMVIEWDTLDHLDHLLDQIGAKKDGA